MTGISIIVVAILGLILGLLLLKRQAERDFEPITVLASGHFVNIFRSIPFIILIVLLIPFTKIILGVCLVSKAPYQH